MTFYVTDVRGAVRAIEAGAVDEEGDVVRFLIERSPQAGDVEPVAELAKTDVAGLANELADGSEVVILDRNDPDYGRLGAVAGFNLPAVMVEIDGSGRYYRWDALGHYSTNRLGHPGYPTKLDPSTNASNR